MVEQAVDWINSLLPPTEGQTANLEYFVQIFRQRYQTPETLMMKMVQELYSCQQQQEETVDDYCTEMLKLAKIVQVKDDLLLYTLLNGLHPEIATYVTQRGGGRPPDHSRYDPPDYRRSRDHHLNSSEDRGGRQPYRRNTSKGFRGRSFQRRARGGSRYRSWDNGASQDGDRGSREVREQRPLHPGAVVVLTTRSPP